ncbi:hypothetical protein BU14_0071s0002 [Porphyra umbilicalis]|uniref:Uncharacterized protein n=1 Tax=Porphyra umbilicalis TaxID=2786 RepID=A0A1X6PFW6_PORUM|nr:hypothetical protein BU14_0071s0002 [Porphyra umbilicalis]|eukprot:OSX79747.1 hypothetical protein BU14_0071s0002 [Porphyra umbilicalis]
MLACSVICTRRPCGSPTQQCSRQRSPQHTALAHLRKDQTFSLSHKTPCSGRNGRDENHGWCKTSLEHDEHGNATRAHNRQAHLRKLERATAPTGLATPTRSSWVMLRHRRSRHNTVAMARSAAHPPRGHRRVHHPRLPTLQRQEVGTKIYNTDNSYIGHGPPTAPACHAWPRASLAWNCLTPRM